MPKSKFISYLCDLAQRDDRAVLAHLRRGLGKEPGTCAETYPYVVPWIPNEAGVRTQNNYYVISALFAMHPDHSDETDSLGATLRTLAKKTDSDASTERRFVAMLNAHGDDLPEHLRHTISRVRAEGIPVNYDQLMLHLNHWDHDSRWVQKRWASDFWAAQPGTSEEETNETQLSDEEK